jgi:hypothetical protein
MAMRQSEKKAGLSFDEAGYKSGHLAISDALLEPVILGIDFGDFLAVGFKPNFQVYYITLQ